MLAKSLHRTMFTLSRSTPRITYAAMHRAYSSVEVDASSTLQVERRDNNVVYVTMNRPDLHNAFNEHVIREITSTFKSLSADTSLRAIVLTGNGKSFSAGADLSWMQKMVNYSKDENIEDSHHLFDMFNVIRTCPVPVIGRINGAAIGGGAGLVSTCDIAFAVDSAKIGFTEVKLGLVPAVISPFVIEKIGKQNASRYFLTGELFNAKRAAQIGLIQESAATIEEVDELVEKTVAHITSAGSNAVRVCKDLIQNVGLRVASPHSASKAYLARTIAQLRVSAEAQQRLTAFLKR